MTETHPAWAQRGVRPLAENAAMASPPPRRPIAISAITIGMPTINTHAR